MLIAWNGVSVPAWSVAAPPCPGATPGHTDRMVWGAVLVRSGRASGCWGGGGKFGGAPGWGAGDGMFDHVSAGGSVLARAISYARSRFRLG